MAAPAGRRADVAPVAVELNGSNRVEVEAAQHLRGPARRRAVILRCGRDTRLLRELSVEPRDYDLIVTLYESVEDGAALCESADSIWLGGLSKFQAAKKIAAAWPQLHGYDHVMLLDPDLTLPASGIEMVFEVAARRRLSLCQPAVSGASFTAHRFLKHRADGSEFFATNFIEVMAPCFSAAAFRRCMPTFDEALSSWGLDFEWPQRLGWRGMGVVNCVQVDHPDRPDLEGGAFYRYLRERDIDPLRDLQRFRDATWFRRRLYIPGPILFPGDLFTPWWWRRKHKKSRRRAS